MTKLEQAARQIIDAWNYGSPFEKYLVALDEALTEPDIEEMTLTQIAAKHSQAEQEPIGTVKELFTMTAQERLDLRGSTKLYAAPIRTKDLTDDEIAKACGWEFGQPLYEWVIGLARAVIAADREKNK